MKQIFPGNDGLVRVVEVMARGRTYKRPIVKLAKLPISSKEEITDTTEEKKGTEKPNEVVPKESNKLEQENNQGVINKIKDSTKPAQNSEKFSRKKKNNKKNMVLCTFAAFLTLFTLIPEIGATGYNLTTFSNGTGAYFQHCNKGVLINGNWRLITYLDMAEYDMNYEILRGNVAELGANNQQEKIARKLFQKSTTGCKKLIWWTE